MARICWPRTEELEYVSPWGRSFLEFDQSITLPEPGSRSEPITTLPIRDLRRYAMLLSQALPVDYGDTPVHLKASLPGRLPNDGWYTVELRSMASYFHTILNPTLERSGSPWRLRVMWYTGRTCEHCSERDLTNANLRDYQLFSLNLGLGFSSVGLVDL